MGEDCLLLSDQGAVYTSQSYQMTVRDKEIMMSKSQPAKPYDNATIETFHGY